MPFRSGSGRIADVGLGVAQIAAAPVPLLR
jgi:hypothetical protein